MDYIRVKSYAKVNLTLDITGAEGGYHQIDSVVASVNLYDLITVKKRRDKLVGITMHGEGSEAIEYADNNAVKAAEKFISAFSTCGADISIYKNIPIGAGLGGSSADVAGVLNALARLYGVGGYAQLKEIADGIGSDCGYMLRGGYARLTGRGDIVKPINSNLKLDLGLLLPAGGGVSSGRCYAEYDRLNVRGTASSQLAENALLRCNKSELGKSMSNWLTIPAARLHGGIAGCVQMLRAFGPLGVTMTGSGSGVFALFENEQYLQYAKSRYRGNGRFIMTKTIIPTKEDKNG